MMEDTGTVRSSAVTFVQNFVFGIAILKENDANRKNYMGKTEINIK